MAQRLAKAAPELCPKPWREAEKAEAKRRDGEILDLQKQMEAPWGPCALTRPVRWRSPSGN